jgi:hypothetical protein
MKRSRDGEKLYNEITAILICVRVILTELLKMSGWRKLLRLSQLSGYVSSI